MLKLNLSHSMLTGRAVSFVLVTVLVLICLAVYLMALQQVITY
jgi:hypothetical protein